MKSKYIFLSHILKEDTPSYGDKEKLNIHKISDIQSGAISNHTKIEMSMHIGTHIDFPSHFFANSQCAEDFGADFFVFNKPLFISIKPIDKIVGDELIQELEKIVNDEYDMLLVKTGEEERRNSNDYVLSNFGFSPKIADFLREHFCSIRVMGFDTISVSSFADRIVGREAHKAFLNPKNPILLLEDMSFSKLEPNALIKIVIVSPLRIHGSDGAPCTVMGEIA